MIEVDDLRVFVGASTSDTDFLTICLNSAVDLVEAYVGDNDVPSNVLDDAYLQVGSELYHRRNAPNGISQFAAFDGSALRIARDPMSSTYPLLNRYVTGGV